MRAAAARPAAGAPARVDVGRRSGVDDGGWLVGHGSGDGEEGAEVVGRVVLPHRPALGLHPGVGAERRHPTGTNAPGRPRPPSLLRSTVASERGGSPPGPRREAHRHHRVPRRLGPRRWPAPLRAAGDRARCGSAAAAGRPAAGRRPPLHRRRRGVPAAPTGAGGRRPPACSCRALALHQASGAEAVQQLSQIAAGLPGPPSTARRAPAPPGRGAAVQQQRRMRAAVGLRFQYRPLSSSSRTDP